jgi:hypothetical protein
MNNQAPSTNDQRSTKFQVPSRINHGGTERTEALARGQQAPMSGKLQELSRDRRIKILLFHGRGVLSALIRWQTRSEYSHAAIMLDDGRIIEAWQGAGVRALARLKRGTQGIDAFEITAPFNLAAVLGFLDAVLADNDGYDYLGVLRFVSRRRTKDNRKWFCSELVFAAIQAGGLNLFERTQAWEVSPGLLARSPLLRQVGASPTRLTRPTHQFQLTTTA